MSNNTNDYELEVWKRLWASRDFELQYFWQRSVFLTAFLVLGITAYGTFQGAFISKIFEGKIGLSNKFFMNIYSLVSIFLCFINIFLSILRIMMTKGSKNAYEVYESALESNIADNPAKNNILKSAYVKLDSKNNNDTNACIFNTDACRYSVSRINIALGIFSLCMFLFLTVSHIILFLYFNDCLHELTKICLIGILILIFCLMLVYLFVLLISTKRC